ncbi:MAG: hypothetical protein JKX78_01110 [Alteromonadaceae bacterium]|nr:hypothetical protein [Alteromonadaceae bacterium]
MRLLFTLLLLAFIASCSKQVVLDEKQINRIEIEAMEILIEVPEPKFDFDYSVKATIVSLTPKNVYITKEGLYIVIDSGFSSESGFFVSRKGLAVDTTSGQDPLYKKLSNNLYQYEIKG